MDEQFLAAIRADPDDDLARLVYADYLEERGDAARAEFIRAQVEAATLDETNPRLATLEDRAHELLARHEGEWLSPDNSQWLVEWEFRRGLLDQVEVIESAPRGLYLFHQPVTRLAVADGACYTDSDFDLKSVRELDLRGGGRFSYGDGYSYETLPNLTTLYFSDALVWEDVAEVVAWNPFRAQLRSLTCSPHRPSAPSVNRFLTALGPARLTQFSVENSGIQSADLAALLAPPTLRLLTDLDISHNPLGPDAWRAFQSADRDLRLQKLDVSGTPLAGISLGPLLNTPAVRDTLTHLDINGTGSARDNLEVLADSGFWSRAESLRLHSATVPALAFESLTRSPGPPKLRLLDLGDNYLRADGVRMLAESAWAGSLTWLSLSNNLLDDDAMRVIADCQAFDKLRTLHLAYNYHFSSNEILRISDAGALALAQSPVLGRLRFLTLSHTAITDLSASQLLDWPHWNLAGLGLGNLGLTARTAEAIAASPKLARLEWLDLSDNPELGGDGLMRLADSPYLTGLLELDIRGIPVNERVLENLRAKLGNRLSR